MYRLFGLILGLLGSSLAVAVTVGDSADCDFSTIEDAVANVEPAAPLVFVAYDKEYTESFVIDREVYLYGGYASCADAENGILGDEYTVWNGNGDSVAVIEHNLSGVIDVLISSFKIQNGDASDANGGGLRVGAASHLSLFDSLLINNAAKRGAGLAVQGVDAKATLRNSNVLFNQATSQGGGIYCSNDAEVYIEGNSGVKHNMANSGGGIAAGTGCNVVVRKGTDSALVLTQEPGISNNTAASDGGGVYLTAGGQFLLDGRQAYPARVRYNNANRGGGVMVFDQNSAFEAINGTIDENTATLLAGGIYLGEPDIAFTMRQSEAANCYNPARCSSLSGNSVTDPSGYGGAGVFYAEANNVVITQTHISSNQADDAVVFYLALETSVLMEGNLIYDNKPYNSGVVPSSLFTVDNGSGGQFDFHYNTLANNINQATFKLSSERQNRLNVFNSIIYNLGSVLNQEGNTNNFIQASCSVMHETATLTGNVADITTTNPQFIDAPNHDFRITTSSVAVDMCNENFFDGAQYRDVVNVVRGYDTPKPNNLGVFDAGAYEVDGDLIFRSGFE